MPPTLRVTGVTYTLSRESFGDADEEGLYLRLPLQESPGGLGTLSDADFRPL